MYLSWGDMMPVELLGNFCVMWPQKGLQDGQNY